WVRRRGGGRSCRRGAAYPRRSWRGRRHRRGCTTLPRSRRRPVRPARPPAGPP
ncbi:MAG: hypothetical protein AVDCRST_MAG66-2252, partial [uncultured Pseudonocardia sp.]